MSDETREGRINIGDLSQDEQELSPEEAKGVKGGILPYIEQDNLVASRSKPSGLQADDVNADNEAMEGPRKL
jgi:hypothetical protein